MKKAQLSTLAPGTPIHYRERAAVVLEHTGAGVFVQLTDSIGERSFGKTNDWRNSSIRKYLNGDFAKQLTEGNTDELLDTVTDLTAMDGTTDYGSSVDKVTLLTFDQNRKYRYIHPLPDEWEWLSTPASTPGGWDEEARYAWSVLINGNNGHFNCSNSFGIRPAFTLSSSLFVEVPGVGSLEDYTDAELLSELLKRQQNT
ncbi:DUF6273 domain-containing protein [Oscillospiraceae bacterium OttesenSCG-928-G22]|nr:DUF6273 domain-containing protein [Oscillospiraceae bacterium OttesenSCG-928-G22]